MPAARFARKQPATSYRAPTITAALAADVLGINRTKDNDLRPMVKALGMMSWNNTVEDDLRREVANWALRHWVAYQNECTRRRDGKRAEPLEKAARLMVIMTDAYMLATPSAELRAEVEALEDAVLYGRDIAAPAAAILAGIEARGEGANHGGMAWAASGLKALLPEPPAAAPKI